MESTSILKFFLYLQNMGGGSAEITNNRRRCECHEGLLLNGRGGGGKPEVNFV